MIGDIHFKYKGVKMGNWDCERCNESYDNRAGYINHINFDDDEHSNEKIEYLNSPKWYEWEW